ncbi:SDR family NAD(P)-dependent oxidoreductase [Methyloradius palustris]|uniref:SDR family oxidoreductase n=1 Tax=Methyloradius palustris TaxID=2778876 RepID=A0A8D5G3W2_9PROT|nr:SDR family NAD(P)-dependent oxidoreductase [Methyloradius palustris]BCM25290.1 hypothetical protein ZMTM_15490 [Methyloradius palustris]
MAQQKQKILLFGVNGSIGSAIEQKFLNAAWDVLGVTREDIDSNTRVSWSPFDANSSPPLSRLKNEGPFDSICWAQGQNWNDNIYSFDEQKHREIYEANVLYILKTLNILLENEILKKPARLCLISSIWQNISRQNKLSYGVSKSAIHGLVLSLVNDLGSESHLINAVLPGALDTPMTHKNLAKEQVSAIENSTQFGRLANLDDVANVVYFLCSSENTGLTGQFIKIDLGYSDVRVI